MSILKVARMGHPVLRETGRALDKSDLRKPGVQKLIDDMVETMHEYSGVGLAAPQVHYSLRLFVGLLEEEPNEDTRPTVVVNPEITPLTTSQEEGWEGCLSIPDIRGLVPRYTDILLKGMDRDGRALELRLKNFAARIAQHETDHLDGVLFLDRMKSMRSLTYLDEYSRYHARESD